MTDLLRLDRLTVEGSREEDGNLIITVRSKTPAFPQCCLLCTPKKLGTKAIRFRDFTIQADPVWLEVKRQRFKCQHCNKISYEDLPDFDADFRLTTRSHPPRRRMPRVVRGMRPQPYPCPLIGAGSPRRPASY